MHRRSRPKSRRARLVFEELEKRAMLAIGSFSPVAHLGSLVYSANGAGSLGAAMESEGFESGETEATTFVVDAGQSITVLVEPTGNLQPSVRLLDGESGNTVLGAATAMAPGGSALITAAKVGGNLADGSTGPRTVRLEVGGVNGTLGDYSFQVLLNASLENENAGGMANNSAANAQDLNANFVDLHRPGAVGSGDVRPGHAAILGTTDSSTAAGVVEELEVNNPEPFALPDPYLTAQDIDPAEWKSGIDPFYGVPSSLLTVRGKGDGTFDYFKFSVPDFLTAGTISITSNFLLESGDSLAAAVFLFDSAGNFINYGDDFSPMDLGFLGAGDYYVGVGTWFSGFIAGNLVFEPPFLEGVYEMLVSIPGKATTPGASGMASEVEPNDPGDILSLLPPPPDLSQFAQDIDDATWVVNSDPFVPFASTIPYVKVEGTGDGTYDYYAFSVPAGGGLVSTGLSESTIFSGLGGDVYLFNADGEVLNYGGVTGLFLDAGTYFVGVGTFDSFDLFAGQLFGIPPQPGETYTLYVSVEGHPYDAPGADLFKFSLTAGESVHIAITELVAVAGDIDVELLSSDGQSLAAGHAGPTNLGKSLGPFTAPFTGDYYARVTGTSADVQYNLIVQRNAMLDLESNSSSADAQTVSGAQVNGRRWVTGYIQSSTTLEAVDSGWYDEVGFHDPENDNYVVFGENATEIRNFLLFDRSQISGEIFGATLSLFNPTNGFLSPDPTETYSLFDVSTSVEELVGGGESLTGIFDDLGTGTSYGTNVVSAADNGKLVNVNLNAQATAALNATDDFFALGGAITSLSRGPDTELIFGFSGGTLPRQLILSVNESDTYRIEVDQGAFLQIDTATPGDGNGVFGNDFDPLVRLYDAAGNLLASNDNGGLDGRNAILNYSVPLGAGGDYYVEVLASPLSPSLTSGEYILSVKGDHLNRPPVLAPLAETSLLPGITHMIPLSATDADGDPVTYFARLVQHDELAFELDQTHDFYSDGNFWYGFGGRNEKWFQGNAGWYFILPSGELYQWDFGPGANGTKIADLSGIYHTYPSLLLDAPDPSLVVHPTVEVVGDQLKVTVFDSAIRTFSIETAATDPHGGVSSQTLIVTVPVSSNVNHAPQLTPIANQSASAGQQLMIPLSATDSDGDLLSYSATLVRHEDLAYELDQTLQFSASGDFWYNFGGRGEKWFLGGSQWYFITPDGAVYQWDQQAGANGTQIAQLSELYHAYPDLLLNAPEPSQVVTPLIQVVGTTLKVTLFDSPLWAFNIQVTVTDSKGAADSKRFLVSLNSMSAMAATGSANTAIGNLLAAADRSDRGTVEPGLSALAWNSVRGDSAKTESARILRSRLSASMELASAFQTSQRPAAAKRRIDASIVDAIFAAEDWR